MVKINGSDPVSSQTLKGNRTIGTAGFNANLASKGGLFGNILVGRSLDK